MNANAVIYARFSSDRQREESIEGQISAGSMPTRTESESLTATLTGPCPLPRTRTSGLTSSG